MDSSNLAPTDWMALLDFYVEAGVDCTLDEHPHNRFEEIHIPTPQKIHTSPNLSISLSNAVRQQSPEATPRVLPALATGSPEQAAETARLRAAKAQSLEELEKLLHSFEGCSLRFSAKNLVFSDGNPASRIMFVGEAPGEEEDRIGKPFVGRSGMLLDRMLSAINLDRNSVYIANVIPWRPPGNRTPTPQEVAICKPFIERQIELIAPDFLVTLGGAATQTILDIKEGILKTRGRWYSYNRENLCIKTLATLHPAYLLRQPLQKRLAWRDMLTLQAELMAAEKV